MAGLPTASGSSASPGPPSVSSPTSPTSPTPTESASSEPVSPTTAYRIPPELPRRTHRKSRAGCATCKKRKIKCDEHRPACLNCILHGVECPYKRGKVPRSPTDVSASVPLTSPMPQVMPSNELELLANFTTYTCSTLATEPVLQEFYQVSVVRWGLRCDFTMHAILAVSSIHMAYKEPQRREHHVSQGIQYHQKALQTAMQLMQYDSPRDQDTTINLFLFSMLTVYFALGSPQSADESGLPEWTFLVRGCKMLRQKLSEDLLAQSPAIKDFLTLGHARWTARQMRRHQADDRVDDRFALLRWRVLERAYDEKAVATYSNAIDELEASYVAARDPSAPHDMVEALMWLWAVSDTLVPLLKAPVPEAVVILAHFGIIIKHYETQWWLRNWGASLVARSHALLDEEHRSWIEWPMAVCLPNS